MAELSVAEIIKKVRRIQITASRAVNDLFAGEYHSVFRGRGMEFDEVREYQPGDEVRTIDWNVTARAGAPFVKRFREERELTVMFVIDVSASGAFGTVRSTKLEMLIEVAALLMFSALKNHDKVGLLLFCDTTVKYLPPRKGAQNVLRFLREIVAARPVARPADPRQALEFLARVARRRSVVFLLSDFEWHSDAERELKRVNRRHELVAITAEDPREFALADVGQLTLEDAETGVRVELDTSSARVREWFAKDAADRRARLDRLFKTAGIDALRLSTAEPYEKSLHRFFRAREKRR